MSSTQAPLNKDTTVVTLSSDMIEQIKRLNITHVKLIVADGNYYVKLPADEESIEYYINLAQKFRSKYQEYIELYNSKKDLKKLVELHNMLADWKTQLWDFDERVKQSRTT